MLEGIRVRLPPWEADAARVDVESVGAVGWWFRRAGSVERRRLVVSTEGSGVLQSPSASPPRVPRPVRMADRSRSRSWQVAAAISVGVGVGEAESGERCKCQQRSTGRSWTSFAGLSPT